MYEQYNTAYFDGVEIGHTGDQPPGYYSAPRGYQVPGKLVKAGRNVIALRLVRHDAQGGLHAPGKLSACSCAIRPRWTISER